MVSAPLVNLWNRKAAILHFAWLSIKIPFRGTYFGLLWTIIEPLLFFVFLYALFTSIRGLGGKEDFAIYLLTGIVLYHAFARGTQRGMNSLRSNIGVISSIDIRREFFPVVSTTTSTITLLIEIAVLFALMPVFSFIPSWTVVFLPLLLILLIVLILGFSYLLSIISIYVKDFIPFWGIITTALLFLSPIFWYLEDAGGFAVGIQKINPVGQIIELGHKMIFGQAIPLGDWLYTSAFVFGIFIFGYAVFQKLQKRVVEVI